MSRVSWKALCRATLLMAAVGGLAFLMPTVAGAKTKNNCPTSRSTPIVVRSNVTLQKNICFSNSDGFLVKKAHVTINLNGFGIFSLTGSNDGVNNLQGANNVTVEKGTIAGFGVGIDTDGALGGKVTNVTVDDSTYDGIEFTDTTNATLDGVVSNDNGDNGYYFDSNHMLLLENGKGNHNDENGIYDEYSLDTLNGMKANDNALSGVLVDYPLTTSAGTYTIENSTASGNGGAAPNAGIQVEDNSPTTLYQAKVDGNTADYNFGWGYWAYQQVPSKNNGAQGNNAGNCHHVSCRNTAGG